MIGVKRTGMTRYRVEHRWHRSDLVVLQIELEGFVPEFTGGAYVGGEIRKWYVDAKPEDVMVQGKQALAQEGEV